MKPAAVQIMQQRVDVAGLTNISCRAGMIEAFDQPFDVGLALHACGELSETGSSAFDCGQSRRVKRDDR